MTKHARRALAALALAAAVPGSAKPPPPPAPTHFIDCDGYTTPNGPFDGLKKRDTFLVTFNVSPHPVPAFIGRTGVEACDTALADPVLLDSFWMRRVTLLRARAIHKLAVGDDAGAIEDLARASAAMKDDSDPLVRRSLGIGLDLVRAYALAKTGHSEEGRRLANAILTERPYNRQVGVAVVAVLGNEGLRAGDYAALKTLGRLDPRYVDAMFELAFDEGKFEEAIRLHPHIAPPVRDIDVGRDKEETAYQEAQRDSLTLLHNAERRARLAYAFAATGHADKALAELAAAKTLVAEHVATAPAAPPAATGDDRAAREARRRVALVNAADGAAGGVVAKWEKLVGWRIGLEGPDADKIIPQLNPNGLGLNGAHVDLLTTASRKRPSPQLESIARTLAARIAAPPESRSAEASILFEGLPPLEIGKTITGYRQSNAIYAILWGGISGFKTIGDPRTGKATVEYVGEHRTANVVEEMALLRAADIARQNGRSGFVITGRRDYRRQLVSGYGAYRTGSDDGFSTQLDIEFVDAAAPPAKPAPLPWRVLSADEVINALGPVFAAPKPPAK